MIVKEKIDFVSISGAASSLSNAANTAYWMADRDNGCCAFQGDSVVNEFHKIAELLGYRVEKIEQPADALAAREVAK